MWFVFPGRWGWMCNILFGLWFVGIDMVYFRLRDLFCWLGWFVGYGLLCLLLCMFSWLVLGVGF